MGLLRQTGVLLLLLAITSHNDAFTAPQVLRGWSRPQAWPAAPSSDGDYAADDAAVQEELEKRRSERAVKYAGLGLGATFITAASAGELYLTFHPGDSGPLLPLALLLATAGGSAAVGLPLIDLPSRLPLESGDAEALARGQRAPRDEGLLGVDRGRGLEVREAGRGRGKGLFATEPIPGGSFLLEYRGEELDEEEFLRRYRTAAFVGDYVFENGPDRFIDAADADLSNLARYMNHEPASAARRCNVRRVRRKWPQTARVLFFAARGIEADEELCFDYGGDYWTGREADVV